MFDKKDGNITLRRKDVTVHSDGSATVTYYISKQDTERLIQEARMRHVQRAERQP